jgi:branched-chain amino acid transport system substrate-binding protein
MRSFQLLAAMLVLAGSVFLAGCGSKEGVPIGMFVSTSGAFSTFGQDTRNAAMLAVEEINAAGGIDGQPIRLVFHDTASRPEEGGNVATRLATQDRVLVAMGAVASGVSLSAAPVFQTQGVPMVSPSSTNPTVTEQGDMIFRICYLDDFQGGACAVFAYKDLGNRRAAILRKRDDAYSAGLASFFSSKFTGLGGEIVRDEAFADGTTDFNTQISNIRGANPDIVFCPVYYTDMSLIARQLREQGVTVPLMGGDGWESDRLIPDAGNTLEGCYFGNHYNQESDDPKVRHFVEAYRKKYGKAPTSLAALGYDVVYVVKRAIEDSGVLRRGEEETKGKSARDLLAENRKAVADALRELKDFEGVTGRFSIDENRNARKSISILRIEGDRFVSVRQVTPEEVAGPAE